MKTLIICKSIHHGSTQKIAERMGGVLGAKVIEPAALKASDIKKYDLIGLGSGLYGEEFHPSVMKAVSSVPSLAGKKVFLFSTAGVVFERSYKEMTALLSDKGAQPVGDFCCKGFNTNSFLKYIGGMNKSRPNATDLRNAESFAKDLRVKYAS